MHSIKDHYWEMLRKAESVMKQSKGKKDPKAEKLEEMSWIYVIAMAGLIKHGQAFDIVSNSGEIEQIIAENEKNKGLLSSGKIKKVPDLVENIIVTNMDGSTFMCSLEDMRRVMGSDYGQYIEKTVILEQEPDIADIELPDLEKPAAPKPAETEKAPKDEKPEDMLRADAEMTDDRLPEFKGDNRYPQDPEGSKRLSTFCYTQTIVKITSSEGQDTEVTFLTYPLDFKENTSISDIVVTAKANHIIRSGVSQGRTSSVKINVGGLKFVVRGHWEDGEFKVHVQPTGKEAQKYEMEQESDFMLPEKRSFSTYALIKHGAKTYNVFPAEVASNTLDGYCACVLVAIEDKNLSIYSPTEEGNFSLSDEAGPFALATYWTVEKDTNEPIFHYEFSDI